MSSVRATGSELGALADHGRQAGCRHLAAVVDPPLAVGIGDELRSAVPEPGRDPLLPHVRGLEDVIVDRDHPVEVGVVHARVAPIGFPGF
jgi:hypothetical protein